MSYMLRILHPDDMERARAEFIAALSGKEQQLRTTFRIISSERRGAGHQLVRPDVAQLRRPRGAHDRTGMGCDRDPAGRTYEERIRRHRFARIAHAADIHSRFARAGRCRRRRHAAGARR